jgi:hypothetical protein
MKPQRQAEKYILEHVPRPPALVTKRHLQQVTQYHLRPLDFAHGIENLVCRGELLFIKVGRKTCAMRVGG